MPENEEIKVSSATETKPEEKGGEAKAVTSIPASTPFNQPPPMSKPAEKPQPPVVTAKPQTTPPPPKKKGEVGQIPQPTFDTVKVNNDETVKFIIKESNPPRPFVARETVG